MLLCSSNRALSSTSAVTCLPFCAARALDEIDDAGERLVRMVHQDVLGADQLEEVGAPLDGGGRPRHHRLVLEVPESVEPVEGVERRQVHRPPHAVHVARLQLEGLREHLHEPLVRVGLDAQPDRFAADPLPQRLLHGLEQILGFVFLNDEVGIAGHPEDRMGEHVETAEQLSQVRADHVLEQDEPDPSRRPGQGNQALEHRRHLHDGEQLLTFPVVEPFHQQHDVEALVVHVREWVAGIDCERRQHRVHARPEVLVGVRALLRGQVRVGDARDAVRREARQDVVPQDPVLFVDQLVRPSVDGRELLGRPEAIGAVVLRLEPRVELLLQAGDADFEELVQVGAEDGKKLDPLEQRVAGVARFLEDARIELEPAQFPIDVELGRMPGHRTRRHHRSPAARRLPRTSRMGRRSAPSASGRHRTVTRALNACSNSAVFRRTSHSSTTGSRLATAVTRTRSRRTTARRPVMTCV
jgi:hypothetical protein